MYNQNIENLLSFSITTPMHDEMEGRREKGEGGGRGEEGGEGIARVRASESESENL